MKDSHWPVFTNVKTNSRYVKFLSFRSFRNLLISFCIGIAVSGLMLHLKAKEFSEDPEFKASLGWYQKWKARNIPLVKNLMWFVKRRLSVVDRCCIYTNQLDLAILYQPTGGIRVYPYTQTYKKDFRYKWYTINLDKAFVQKFNGYKGPTVFFVSWVCLLLSRQQLIVPGALTVHNVESLEKEWYSYCVHK